MDGWIKLHRQLLKSDTFKNEKLLKVWVYCLLKASHAEHEQLVGRQKVKLLPGQFVYGRKRAAEVLDMPESTLRDYVEILLKSGNIAIRTTNKFSVITVVKWDTYQSDEEKPDSRPDNKRTANGQQMDTNKNGKNGKNGKEKKIYAPCVSMTEEEYQKLIEKFGQQNTKDRIERLSLYKKSKGKKYKCDYSTILAWARKDEPKGEQNDRDFSHLYNKDL